MIEAGDIQGLALFSYRWQPFARFFLVRFGAGDARAWLSRLLADVSSAASHERRERRRRNIAFTAQGLSSLGLDAQSLASFPREFLQGMAHPERSLALGDAGPNSPAHWEFGGGGEPVDAVLCIYAPTSEELESETEVVEESLAHHELSATAEDLYLSDDGRDHFGFAAPNTNPRIRRLFRRNKNAFDPSVPLGEFVLGYRDARGYVTEGPRAPLRIGTRPLPRLTDYGRSVDLGRNGTFLAVRKLAQDVPGFMQHIRARAAELGGDPRAAARLAGAELVGRFPSGAPLALYGADEPGPGFEANRFGYRGDEAARCPIAAHVRRANPRDALDEDPRRSLERLEGHRLLRRGRLYGERYEPETPGSWQRDRGLMFVAVNASLRRQFEFVQGALLGGSRGPPGSLEAFVRVRGGLYLFMPGLTALGYLSEL